MGRRFGAHDGSITGGLVRANEHRSVLTILERSRPTGGRRRALSLGNEAR